MNPAESARLQKEAHPERYCPDKKCLWRIVQVRTGEFRPCPKHMKKDDRTQLVFGPVDELPMLEQEVDQLVALDLVEWDKDAGAYSLAYNKNWDEMLAQLLKLRGIR